MPLHPRTPTSLASFKSRLVLPFWYRLTRVVPDKGPLNGCVCVCVCVCVVVVVSCCRKRCRYVLYVDAGQTLIAYCLSHMAPLHRMECHGALQLLPLPVRHDTVLVTSPPADVSFYSSTL